MYDKTGREIRTGDLLKIFHFIGRRKKRYYMYKYVSELREFETHKIFVVLHLSKDLNSYYNLTYDENIHPEIEIIQGYNTQGNELDYEDRPRIKI